MTDRLAEIKARLKAAEGNIFVSDEGIWFGDVTADADGTCHVWYDDGKPAAVVYNNLDLSHEAKDVAALIQHAPDDLRWAVAEIERMRDLLGRAERLLSVHGFDAPEDLADLALIVAKVTREADGEPTP